MYVNIFDYSNHKSLHYILKYHIFVWQKKQFLTIKQHFLAIIFAVFSEHPKIYNTKNAI